jgi:hypothetical protein
MSDDPETTQKTAELRAEIEQTREQLGDTVEALAAKADVTGRSKAKIAELQATAMAKADTAVAALPEPAAAPIRRGVGVVIAHPAMTVGALAGSALLVRGIVKRRNR